jgi:hypothetical protein
MLLINLVPEYLEKVLNRIDCDISVLYRDTLLNPLFKDTVYELEKDRNFTPLYENPNAYLKEGTPIVEIGLSVYKEIGYLGQLVDGVPKFETQEIITTDLINHNLAKHGGFKLGSYQYRPNETLKEVTKRIEDKKNYLLSTDRILDSFNIKYLHNRLIITYNEDFSDAYYIDPDKVSHILREELINYLEKLNQLDVADFLVLKLLKNYLKD